MLRCVSFRLAGLVDECRFLTGGYRAKILLVVVLSAMATAAIVSISTCVVRLLTKMEKPVICGIRADNKVAWIVVQPVLVDVVNLLITNKLPTQGTLHKLNVSKHLLRSPV